MPTSSPPVHSDLDALLGGERDGVAQSQRLLPWCKSEFKLPEDVVQGDFGLLNCKTPAWAPPGAITCTTYRSLHDHDRAVDEQSVVVQWGCNQVTGRQVVQLQVIRELCRAVLGADADLRGSTAVLIFEAATMHVADG